ncbi:MAG: zinc-binding alcohol dehydrogenase family protein [Nannocystaceae bacterium]
MRAIGFHQPLPITDESSLVDLELATPEPAGRDLRVAVHAVSVNPVDVKIRRSATPPPGQPRILGFDAAGVVDAVGPEVTLFKPGDPVYYAGAIHRPGSNAEYQLVDERLVGAKPRSLDFAAAAALPLTSITAWELLFDRLEVAPGKSGASAGELLIVGGAGGVGSILIQLARRLTGLTVIATASRPETRAWCESLGAHHVIDHGQPLVDGLKAVGLAGVRYVAGLTHSDEHWQGIVDAVAPQGRVALIDDPPPIDVRMLKRKSVSLHWELMFTRSLYQTADMIAQHRLLGDVAVLVDDGVLRTTATESAGRLDAATLRRAHAQIESGRTRGKIVLDGIDAGASAA